MDANKFTDRIFNIGKQVEHYQAKLRQYPNLDDEEIGCYKSAIDRLLDDVETAKYELNIALSCGDEPWNKIK